MRRPVFVQSGCSDISSFTKAVSSRTCESSLAQTALTVARGIILTPAAGIVFPQMSDGFRVYGHFLLFKCRVFKISGCKPGLAFLFTGGCFYDRLCRVYRFCLDMRRISFTYSCGSDRLVIIRPFIRGLSPVMAESIYLILLGWLPGENLILKIEFIVTITDCFTRRLHIYDFHSISLLYQFVRRVILAIGIPCIGLRNKVHAAVDVFRVVRLGIPRICPVIGQGIHDLFNPVLVVRSSSGRSV